MSEPANWQAHGVDVLYLVMTTTDTPALRDLLGRSGMGVPPGIASPDDVAEMGLTSLSQGPVQNFGLREDEAGFAITSAAQRRERVKAITAASKSVFGQG